MEHDINSDHFTRLRSVAKEAPLTSGVYIMRDGDGSVIYVGKARILRNRLSSYFSGDKDVKTKTLLRHVRSIETIQVNNEYEALLLENTLIKQYSPKYNINLKDGKSYPVVRITNEDFPRVFRTRRIIEDGSLYFGPFPNVHAVDTMLELIDKLFPLRKCRNLKNRKAPCMYYHIGRCRAPCVGKISKEEYAVYVERVQKLLSGDTASLLAELSDRMNEAAVAMKFERAAQLRDARRAIEDLSATNAVIDFDPDARDYLAWAAEGVLATYTVFSMRGGKMTGRELYRARTAATEEESLELFLTTYYSLDRLPPPRIYLAEGNLDFNNLSLWFKKELGTEPVFLSADERRHEAVLALAHQNAREDLVRRLKERGAGPALDELARELNLQARPDHIEGFDIAQLDGKHTVASLIVFKDGIPDKKNYRHFRLRTVEGKIDDFGAMREVVSRRYSRLLADGDDIPKLILIDGGLGQVNAAKGVLDELGLDCDLVGLAKRDEELWLPGASRPIRLAKSSEALKVLQFVRDETHRFATGFNQKLRSKDLSLQSLQSVEGIGASRAAKLIKEFGSLDAIASSSFEEIAGRCSLSEDLAKAIGAAARQALAERAAEKERLRSSQAKTRRGAIKRGAIKRGAIKRGAPMYESDPELASNLAAEALEDYDDDGAETEAENNKGRQK